MNLLRKELRGLFPLLVLVLLVHASDIISEPFTKRLDEKAWAGQDLYPGHGDGAAMVLMILALMAGYSLFPREHDDGTIHFLHSLPVSRTRVFLAKVACAFLVLATGVVAGQLTGYLLSLPNDSSLTGHQFRLQVALGSAFLYVSYSTFVLAHAVLLSFFRRFGLVLYGLAAWLVIALKKFPELAFLDPTRLVGFEYEGQRLVFPWHELAWHAGIAVFALGLAWFLWTGPGERFGRAFLELVKKPEGKLALGCGTALLVVLVVALLVRAAWDDAKESVETEEKGVRYVSFQTVSAETEHYRFTYPVNLRERALVLIRGADASYEAVRALLGAREGAPIVADLTDVSPNHAGITKWQKVCVGLAGDESESLLRHVFHHETAHAFQLQESADRAETEFASTQFFLEGNAEWAGFETVANPEIRAVSRRHALAAVRRQRIRFDDLCDARRFAEKHDKNLVYPVGETWVTALARAYGAAAPGNVLRAMARKDAPRGLAPLAFWQDVLQAAGSDLERVNAAWSALLDEVERENPGFLDALPRISGGVARKEEGIVVLVARLDREPLSGTHYWARTRPNAESGDDETLSWKGVVREGGAIEFRVRAAALTGREFEFQLGIQLDERALPMFEDWQQGAVPK